MSKQSEQSKGGARDAPAFGDRLLAEAMRFREEAAGSDPQAADAEAAARGIDGGFEERLIARAASVPAAPALSSALANVRATLVLAGFVSVLAAGLAGATTARVALDAASGEPVNVYWALGSLLGVHVLALALWAILFAVRPATAATGTLGATVFALGRWLATLTRRGPLPLAALRATATVQTGGRIGRWALSTVSHAMWTAFLAAGLVMLLFLLGTRQLDFVWETTILSADAYVSLTRSLAMAPKILGLPAPTASEIAASRWPGEGSAAGAAREAWSGFLIGCVVAYGLIPRAVLLGLCAAGWWRSAKAYRLDIGHPDYARLRPRLMPVARQTGVVDADTGVAPFADAAAEPTHNSLKIGTSGPIAIVGVEIDRPEAGWPPPAADVPWLDLGLIDDGGARRRAVAELEAARERPRLILAVCSLTATPDRGVGAFLRSLQQGSRVPAFVLLTHGQKLRARGDAARLEQRAGDWRRLAEAAGVPGARVLEVDLDHLTDASSARLAAWLGGTERAPFSGAEIARAFGRIVAAAESWPEPPTTEQQADLHRELASMYRRADTPAPELFRVRLPNAIPRLDDVRASAGRMVELLPPGLRLRPRWLAAGAAAGALGCVGAAALAGPAVLAALPAWASVGALISQVAAAHRPAGDAPAEPSGDLGGGVASAALFALVLHLQGRPEPVITRLLESVLGTEDPPPMPDAEAARRWLATLEARLGEALRSEDGART